MVRLSRIAVLFAASSSLLRPSSTARGFVQGRFGAHNETGPAGGYVWERGTKASHLVLGDKVTPKRTTTNERRVDLSMEGNTEGCADLLKEGNSECRVDLLKEANSECCVDPLKEGNMGPGAPDKTVLLYTSCLEEGDFCKMLNEYAPTATVPAVPSVKHPEGGSGPTTYDDDDVDGDDAYKGPPVTNREVDVGVALSEAADVFLGEQLLFSTLPSLPHSHGGTGHVRPRFCGVDKTIIAGDAEGEASPEKGLYDYYPVETSKAMVVVAPCPPVVLETSLIVLKFRVYGLDEETELSLLRTLVSQNDEAASEDGYLTALETVNAVGPSIDIDIDFDLEAATEYLLPTALEAVHVTVPPANIDGNVQVYVQAVSWGGRVTAHEEFRVAGLAVNIDCDVQATGGDRHPTVIKASNVTVLTFDIDGDAQAYVQDASRDDRVTTHEDACAVVPAFDDVGWVEQVGRGSVWATELITRAKGAEPTCAVVSEPLVEISQYAPARTSVAINVDDGHPRLAVKLVALLRRVWSWVTIFFLIYVFVQLASLSYSATLPLRVDDKLSAGAEYMTYWRRFIAVSVLRMRAKRAGDRTLRRTFQVVLCIWIWQLWDTWAVFPLGTGLVTITYFATSPRHARTWVEDIVDMAIFKILCDFFDVKLVREDEKATEGHMYSNRTCMLAQFPLSLAEIVHDLLGVRRTQSNVKDMLVDGREGVAVISGGPGEPTVFESPDSSALTRQVVSVACEDHDSVVPVYVSGASRTHELLPGCESRVMRTLARKFPGLVLRGVFGLVSYRQQLTVVLGRPTTVTRATFRDVVTQRTCVEVEEAMVHLAAKNRPEWDKRESLFTRGPIGW